jgi:hypothetical protein
MRQIYVQILKWKVNQLISKLWLMSLWKIFQRCHICYSSMEIKFKWEYQRQLKLSSIDLL